MGRCSRYRSPPTAREDATYYGELVLTLKALSMAFAHIGQIDRDLDHLSLFTMDFIFPVVGLIS